MPDQRNQVLFFRHKGTTLKILYYYLHSLYRLTQKFSKTILIGFIVVLIGALYYSKQTKIAVRMEELSDPNLHSFKEMINLKNDFTFEDKFTLIIKKNSSFNAQDFCLIKNWLNIESNQNPAVVSSNSIFQLRKIDYNEKTLFYPPLINNPCENEIDWEGLKQHQLLEMYSSKKFDDLIIHFTINPYSFEEQEKYKTYYDYHSLDKILESAKKNLQFEVIPGGTLYFQKSVLEGVKHSEKTNLIAASLLFVGYLFLYRSLIGAIALLAVIFTINVIIKAGMGIMGHMLDPLTSCIFLLLTISAIEDYILLSFLVFKKKMRFHYAIKKLLLPSFLTSVTTAIGFGSLALSTNPSLIHFSLWTATGAMLEWAAMFLLLPALVKVLPMVKQKIEAQPIPKSFLPKELIKFTPGKKLALSLALIPLFLIFIYNKANLNYSPFDMFDSQHPISEFRSHILQTRKTEGEISIIFKDPQLASESIIQKISKLDNISMTYSEKNLDAELINIPKEYHSLIYEDFKRTDIGKLFFSADTKRAIAYIKSYDTKDIPKIVREIEKICGSNCKVASEIIVSKDYALGILQTLFDSSLSGFSSIILLLCWLIYNLRGRYYLPIIFSTLWASFVLLIFVILWQFKINVVTCVALSVLIGLAGDNAIQFLLLQKDSFQQSVQEIGEASSENFTLMMLLTSTLFLSYFQTPKTLAFLMIIGVLFMFIGDLWILNGLIAKKKKN